MGDDSSRKHNLVGPIEVAECISVPYLEVGTDTILANQGCTFVHGEKGWDKYIMIMYPMGSKRQELWPRTMESRYIVTFPGGFEVLEVIDRNGVCKGLYIDNPVQK